MNDIADAYMENEDVTSASYWYNNAAAVGYSRAIYNLGILAQYNNDEDGALDLFYQATINGDIDSVNAFISLYNDSNNSNIKEKWYEQYVHFISEYNNSFLIFPDEYVNCDICISGEQNSND